MSDRVRITDVAPRDGLQNEADVVGTDDKVRLISRLGACGVDEIEVASFVRPDLLPQLADGADVIARLSGVELGGSACSALVPNQRGMQNLLSANSGGLIGKVSVFTAASETFSQRNTNASIEETLGRFRPVVALAREHGLRIRGYVSCAIACPFEGQVLPSSVADVAESLAQLGVDEVDVADTIGVATPEQMDSMLTEVMERLGAGGYACDLTLHLHDTFGRASDCVEVALDLGVRSFDGASGGLGGCPFASTADQRAPGNIDTVTLCRVIERAGFETGVDHERLAAAGVFAQSLRSEPGGVR